MTDRAPFHPGRDNWEQRALAAEKTVEVLKQKVRQLYDEGRDVGGVHRQLERQRLRRETLAIRTEELERYNAQLEQEVADRTRAIRNIIDNVTFGFLIIDRELRVQEGFTRSCAQIFEREVQAGDNFGELLGLSARERSHLFLGVDQIFDDFLDEEVSLGQLPTRFELDGRVLQAEGRVVRAASNDVTGVLFTLSDITSLERARQESQHNGNLVRILRQRGAFMQFVRDMHSTLATAAAIDEQIVTRRAVHTIKGNAASYGIQAVVERAHELEEQEQIDAESLGSLEDAMRGFLQENRQVLDIDYDERVAPSFEVSAEQLARLRELIDEDDNEEALRAWTSSIVKRPMRDLLGPVDVFIDKLARRLEKDVQFEIEGADTLVDAELMRPITSNLNHLLRNAIDHGLEPPWDRGDKPRQGTIAVQIEEQDECYEIRVRDDGRGVDFERLAQRARELGALPSDGSPSSDEELVELMFLDGVSATQIANEISGRGVGMSSVRMAVEQRGGVVKVTTAPGEGTEVLLSIPRDFTQPEDMQFA
jgi:two-component system chemotaxis sensor kinase CheA